MPGYVFIATSLDGYIALPDGNLDWLTEFPNHENEDFGYDSFISQMDAVVMGRGTYEKVLTFPEWPYQKPVFVLSKSIKISSGNGSEHVIISDKTPVELNAFLQEQGYKNFYVDGGKTITSFLENGLISDLIITKVPVLLGQGISLFSSMSKIRKLTHVKTQAFKNGMVQNWYKIK